MCHPLANCDGVMSSLESRDVDAEATTPVMARVMTSAALHVMAARKVCLIATPF
jgi:hypothetical protein